MLFCLCIALSLLLLPLRLLLLQTGPVVTRVRCVLWHFEPWQGDRLLPADYRLVLLFRIARLDLRIPVIALLGTLDGIGRDQRMFEPPGRDADDHALTPGQHQRLCTAER